MKKLFKFFALAIISACVMTGCGSQKNLYPDTGMITDIDIDSDLVTYVTQNGNEWQFYGVEDWTPGDIVSVILDDNGTDIVYDDIIVDIRYSGWCDTPDTWVR